MHPADAHYPFVPLAIPTLADRMRGVRKAAEEFRDALQMLAEPGCDLRPTLGALETVVATCERAMEERERSSRIPYRSWRCAIEDGDVLLVRSRGWVAALIRWATRSRYSHAGLAAWWGDRLMMVESVEGKGCRALPLSDAVEGADVELFKPVGCQLDRPRVVAAACERLGRPYGWRAVVRDALARLPGLALLLRRRWFELDDLVAAGARVKCSTLVALAYRAGGVDLVPNLGDTSTDPADLARSALLRRVGTLAAP